MELFLGKPSFAFTGSEIRRALQFHRLVALCLGEPRLTTAETKLAVGQNLLKLLNCVHIMFYSLLIMLNKN